jgi:predicted dehydrogenase
MAATFQGDPLQNTVSQQLNDGHELQYLVIGDKGAAATDVFRRSIRRWAFIKGEKKQLSHVVEQITWDPSEDARHYHNTIDQTRDVVRRVSEGLPPAIAPEDALQTMELCFAAEQSADLTKPVYLP